MPAMPLSVQQPPPPPPPPPPPTAPASDPRQWFADRPVYTDYQQYHQNIDLSLSEDESEELDRKQYISLTDEETKVSLSEAPLGQPPENTTVVFSMPAMPLSVQQPPPPPPPPPPTAPASDPRQWFADRPVYTAPFGQPPENTTVFFSMPAMPLSVQQPPPPPPPPPPTAPASDPRQWFADRPVYTGLMQADRPHPTLPEAGPSKRRKTRDNNVADAHCENCVQHEIRNNLYRQENNKLHCELEFQKSVCQQYVEKYKAAKELLSKAVFFRILKEQIEGERKIQLRDIMSQFNPTSFGSGSSISSNLDDSFLQTLSALPRRPN